MKEYIAHLKDVWKHADWFDRLLLILFVCVVVMGIGVVALEMAMIVMG